MSSAFWCQSMGCDDRCGCFCKDW